MLCLGRMFNWICKPIAAAANLAGFHMHSAKRRATGSEEEAWPQEQLACARQELGDLRQRAEEAAREAHHRQQLLEQANSFLGERLEATESQVDALHYELSMVKVRKAR